MKKIVFILAAGFFLIVMPLAMAGGPDYVYGKNLSIKDVTPFIEMELAHHPHAYIKAKADVKLVKVYGIHQNGRAATAYFRFQYTTKNKQGMRDADIDFIRFNTGKWFHKKSRQYLTK